MNRRAVCGAAKSLTPVRFKVIRKSINYAPLSAISTYRRALAAWNIRLCGAI